MRECRGRREQQRQHAELLDAFKIDADDIDSFFYDGPTTDDEPEERAAFSNGNHVASGDLPVERAEE
jgi:hypothetical protein